MSNPKPLMLIETDLGREALNLARENRVMRDFLLTASTPARNGCMYVHSREDLEKKANKVLLEMSKAKNY